MLTMQNFTMGFALDFTDEQLSLISKIKEKFEWNFRKKVSRSVHQDDLFLRVVGKRKFDTVLAASFTSSYRIRWVHTSFSNKVFHSATALFTRNNIFQKIALYNNLPRAMQSIQKAESIYNTHSIMDPLMFIECPKNYLIKTPKPFITHVEENAPYHFLELKNGGARVETFNKETDRNLKVNYIQAEPDIIYDDGTNIILVDQKLITQVVEKIKFY
jgi:hypothetical protein